MTESKHTPGPWGAERAAFPVFEAYDFAIRASVGHGPVVIGEAFGRATQTVYLPAEANARLIAAAPDLLEALEGLLAKYTELVSSGDCGSWDPEKESEVIAARAAIAKAKGDA
ncbi:hypothetical protein [Pseudohoeflea coraliihabitans]|uniref:Uncharacterized protein n=1 Tax=Pseudohoeflea coraliihabitans TaxID=2860393 RepID=A0ABS6WIA5_9HYPH|nr:hypothetical protein [Pseudohoeflea sp. DP4N28-3]MBW3095668.1 hypothetical protein [Pseudohoeflea sp. DP4N28-3]